MITISSTYFLKVSGFNKCSTAGDSLANLIDKGAAGHHWREFTTYDNDNDPHNKINCAEFISGGWWFSYCSVYNPNHNNMVSMQIKVTWVDADV